MAIDFNMCFNEYITSTDKNHTRIIQDFNNEIRTRFDYQGREIYEMLQNAEDAGAEAESEVYVVVDYSDNVISIANKGGKPFSDEGFTSILRANQSSKIGSKLIGNKGLGFRSILNWAEEIEIHSKNIKCTFSEEIALKRWKEIQEKIEANIGEKKTKSFVKQVEKNAKDQGFDIPVPILPLPKYEKTTKSKEYTTKITIKLQDDESVADSIIDQLESLDERVLLFLTWCKSISITGNQVENRFITCDKNKWLFYSEEGSIGDKEYCISLAYPKEQSKLEDTNPLYSFFPTKINVNLPIIIHATFELTSSRNGLVDNDANKKIQEFVANAVIDFVEQKLSSFYSAPSWDIYNAIDIDTIYDDIWTFKYRLDSLKKTAKIYPTINGVYECLKDIYYYSEDFSEYVISLKAKGWSGLNNILIPNKPENLDIKKSYNEAEFQKIINQLSEWITSIEDRCDLIKALKEIDTQIKFDLLLDQDNKLLSSTSGENVYINTGQYLKGLPDNLGLKFVNEDLIQYLIDNIFSIRTLGQENQKRNLSNYLNQICKVTTSDVASVKGELKKYSKKISQEPNHLLRNRYYRELIGCVIENQENLVDKSSTSETNSPTNEPWMLLAKDGSFYPAYNLILKPHKYFDGVERYMLDLSYFSINVEDSNSYENLFYNVLNISKYIPIVDENFSSDKTYLDYLKDKFDNEITLYNCRRAKNRIKNQTQFLADEYV